MSNFKVGQKVVCVNNSAGWLSGVNLLIVGEVYTVQNTMTSDNGKLNIVLQETVDKGCWDASRFQPLVEYGFADEVEAYIKEKVKQDTLIESFSPQ